ncbi:protein GrpE-like [Rattus rattus]|uniref:protein GrpE-like n=1 Tax=Rattus rattus TaxID=10117 RepID=UPI0013F2B8EC|nr:protein GrpE-like [Rattus rattus]
MSAEGRKISFRKLMKSFSGKNKKENQPETVEQKKEATEVPEKDMKKEEVEAKDKEIEEENKEESSDSIEDSGELEGDEDVSNMSDDVEELRQQILELQTLTEAIQKKCNDEMLEFVDKKSKEAESIIEKRCQDLTDKLNGEFEEKLNYKYSKPLAQLVDVISQFETVITSINNPEVAGYLVGFKMFLGQFESLLSSFQIISFLPNVGDDFDSYTMQAVSVKQTDNEEENGKITAVFQKGYKLQDRILRLSTVEVFKLKDNSN